jgi:hypothetical protein
VDEVLHALRGEVVQLQEGNQQAGTEVVIVASCIHCE